MNIIYSTLTDKQTNKQTRSGNWIQIQSDQIVEYLLVLAGDWNGSCGIPPAAGV